MTASVFSLADLTYRYDESHFALRNVSLALPQGKITAVLGMSGSGKSTLLALLGLLRSQNSLGGGTIQYNGGSIISYDGLSRTSAAALRAQDFGFVLQSSFLMPNLTCQHNVLIPLLLAGVPWQQAQQRLQLFVQRLENVATGADPQLAKQLSKLPSRLSGGQRQRMAVIRAILHDPRVVFADEPFSSLDPESADRTARLFCDWQAGKLSLDASGSETELTQRSLFLVTHDLSRAIEMADAFVLMSHGECLENRIWTRDELPDRSEIMKLLAGT